MKILYLLIVFILLAGCTSGMETALPTLQPSLQFDSIPTITPTVDPTATFATTPIPTLIPTDLPTLAPEEAQATVLRLLSQSETCKLPCWWGVVPGKTKWSEIYPFF